MGDSAYVIYWRYLTIPSMMRAQIDPIWLSRVYHRVAELAEARGDRATAVDMYQKYITMRRNADPELQPQVRDAKRRLAALQADRAR
jgi:hypothetical protein